MNEESYAKALGLRLVETGFAHDSWRNYEAEVFILNALADLGLRLVPVEEAEDAA